MMPMAPSGRRQLATAFMPTCGSAKWCNTPVDTIRSKSLPSEGSSSIGSRFRLQVEQSVLVLEVLLMIERRLADIDRRHFRIRVHESENRRLVRAAARDQNIEIGLVFPIRPQNPVRVAGVEPLPVVGQPDLEVFYRLGVPVTLVLASDHIGTRVVVHFCTGSFNPSTSIQVVNHAECSQPTWTS